MGYLASGYAFGAAPDWDGLRKLLAAFELRGYKHKSSPLTLLDAWKPRRDERNRYPFTSPPLQPGSFARKAPQSPAEVAFDAVCDALRAEEHVPYEPGWLGVPLRVAAAAGTATFAFAADDDTYDSAAMVRDGSLVARCRVGLFDVSAEGGAVTVLPYIDEESEQSDEDDDGEDEAEVAALDALTSLPNVRVLEPRKIAGGFRIYQHPSELWPTEWGNAAKILGFGTFDPFLEFEAAFEPVFEAAPSRSKPWWQLWG